MVKRSDFLCLPLELARMLELPLLVLHRTSKVCYIFTFPSLNLRGEIPEGLNSQVLSFSVLGWLEKI